MNFYLKQTSNYFVWYHWPHFTCNFDKVCRRRRQCNIV